MSIQFFTLFPQIASLPEDEWLLTVAVNYFERGHDAQAQDMFSRVIKRGGGQVAIAQRYLERIENRCDELPFAEGVHLLQKGRYVEAHERFNKVIDIGRRRKKDALGYLEQLEIKLTDPMPSTVSVAEDASVGQSSVGDILTVEPENVRFDIPLFESPYEGEKDIKTEARSEEKPQHETIVRRTPHMQCLQSRALKPSSSFGILIYADKKALDADEEGEEISFDPPPEMNSFDLDVMLLPTDHFTLNEEESKTLTITRNKDLSNFVHFYATVKSEKELIEQKLNVSSAFITALFTYKGRPSGKVRRKLAINLIDEAVIMPGVAEMIQLNESILPDTDEDRIDANLTAAPADLNVTIVADEDGNGTKFWCTVQTALLPGYATGVTKKWVLPQAAPDLVKYYMHAFEDPKASKSQRIIMLNGTGMELFEAAPKNFRDVIWELFDANKMPRTVSIVSEEPYMPWELMIPTREIGGMFKTLDPLGVQFILGRWTKGGHRAATQKISMVDSYVVAPTYPERPLQFAKEESAFVIQKFPGEEINPATTDKIDEVFKAASKTVIHFACHGENEGTGQVIRLDDEQPFYPFSLRGMDSVRKALAEKKAFIFINACEVGRSAPSLVGAGGFAKTFIDMGAGAVIAPLWSVRDDIAHQVALKFYQRITEDPSIPFAEVFRQLRAKAYTQENEDGDKTNGEDSYAAYCFYGDPLLRRADG